MPHRVSLGRCRSCSCQVKPAASRMLSPMSARLVAFFLPRSGVFPKAHTHLKQNILFRASAMIKSLFAALPPLRHAANLYSTHRFGLPVAQPPVAVPSQTGDKPGQTQRCASSSAARCGLSSRFYPCHQDSGLRRGERCCQAVRSIGRELCSRPAASPSGGVAREAWATARGEGGSGDGQHPSTLNNPRSAF